MSKADKLKDEILNAAAGRNWVKVTDLARRVGCTAVYAHVICARLEVQGFVEIYRGQETVGNRVRPVNYVRMV